MMPEEEEAWREGEDWFKVGPQNPDKQAASTERMQTRYFERMGMRDTEMGG